MILGSLGYVDVGDVPRIPPLSLELHTCPVLSQTYVWDLLPVRLPCPMAPRNSIPRANPPFPLVPNRTSPSPPTHPKNRAPQHHITPRKRPPPSVTPHSAPAQPSPLAQKPLLASHAPSAAPSFPVTPGMAGAQPNVCGVYFALSFFFLFVVRAIS